MSAWINRLSKEEAVLLVQQYGIDPTAHLDQLRRRLREYVATHPEARKEGEPLERETGLEYQDETSESDEMPDSEEAGPSRAPMILNTMERIKLIDQMRKWGLHFNGTDPLTFLERIEELRAGYGLEHDQLLLGLPECLQANALLWYRNNRMNWATWDDFCNDVRTHFLPPGYQNYLRRRIQSRSQQQGETFQAYSTEILTMMRRAGGYSGKEQVEQVYENMDPDYQLYITLSEGTTMTELIKKAAQFEEISRRRKNRTDGPKPEPKPIVATTVYNRQECCWRCKQRGHTRWDCKRQPKKFCSQCGKDGILSRDCHPPPGNARRAGDAAAAV